LSFFIPPFSFSLFLLLLYILVSKKSSGFPKIFQKKIPGYFAGIGNEKIATKNPRVNDNLPGANEGRGFVGAGWEKEAKNPACLYD
jgi:hypothetical protein